MSAVVITMPRHSTLRALQRERRRAHDMMLGLIAKRLLDAKQEGGRVEVLFKTEGEAREFFRLLKGQRK